MATGYSPFLKYSTPHHSMLYSSTFFGGLTFRQADKLVLPTIYPPNTISQWTFTNELPAESDCEVQPGEGIPDIFDLVPILRDMEAAFLEGSRSVSVSINLSGGTIYRMYGFSTLVTR